MTERANLAGNGLWGPVKCGLTPAPAAHAEGCAEGSLADRPRPFSSRPNDRGGPQSFEGLAGDLRPPPHSRSGPGYGRDPVGNGHAAAGFSAGAALVIAAVDGGTA